MSSPLASAIREGRPWLDRFTRREYEKAFRAYMDLYGAGCRQQIDDSGDRLQELAEEVLDELAESRRKARFWNRSTLAFDQQQTVIKYFTPMLLELEQAAFSDVFHAAWCRRWPNARYEQADYARLRKGFVNVILGITIPEKD